MSLNHLKIQSVGYLLWCLSDVAWGRIDCESNNYGGTGTTFTLPPVSIVVARDAFPGATIGLWGPSYLDLNAFGCRFTTSTEYANVGIAANPLQSPRIGSLIGDDGNTYTVYGASAYWSRGLGYIVRWRTLYEGGSTDWQPLIGTTKNLPVHWRGPVGPMAASERFLVGLEVQVRYVMLSEGLQSGVMSQASGNMVRFNVIGDGTVYYDDDAGSSDRKVMSQGANTITIERGGTCTTPDVNVVLPPVAISDFSGAASSAGTTPFDLRFNNCPAGFHSVDYYFTPTTSILDVAAGVVALDDSSTASGIGIQLTQADRTALRFGMSNIYRLAYDPNVAGSYSVPLQAAYYQLGAAPASSGTVRTSITFTADYR